MYEIRIYRLFGRQKSRTATIKKTDRWFGFFAWCRLWFTLRRVEKERQDKYVGISRDCSPSTIRP
jgi:hypothetical protein